MTYKVIVSHLEREEQPALRREYATLHQLVDAYSAATPQLQCVNEQLPSEPVDDEVLVEKVRVVFVLVVKRATRPRFVCAEADSRTGLPRTACSSRRVVSSSTRKAGLRAAS